MTSRLVRDLAPEVLEYLRRGAVVHLMEMPLSRDVSMETRRRCIYHLRDLGAPIVGHPRGGHGGYELTDKRWRMPGPKVRVITGERIVTKIVHVPVPDINVATTAELIGALERRGYTVRVARSA